MIEHPCQKILGQLLHNETSDNGSTIHNTKYAQPIIDKKMREEKQSNKRIEGLDYTMTRNSRFL
jgi:hypothetical protein